MGGESWNELNIQRAAPTAHKVLLMIDAYNTVYTTKFENICNSMYDMVPSNELTNKELIRQYKLLITLLDDKYVIEFDKSTTTLDFRKFVHLGHPTEN